MSVAQRQLESPRAGGTRPAHEAVSDERRSCGRSACPPNLSASTTSSRTRSARRPGRSTPKTLRARTLLHLAWDDGAEWQAWAIALPSKAKLYCDSDDEETRVLASGGRNEGDESDRVFLQLLAESAGESFGIEMAGGAPARVRSSIADRAFLVEFFVNLFEVTGAEDSVRAAIARRHAREWPRLSARRRGVAGDEPSCRETYRTPDAIPRPVPGTRTLLLPRHLAQERQVGEHHARAHDHRGQRVLGDEDRQAGFVAQALVEIAQQRAAAGEDDAAIVDVGRELGRNAFERVADRLDDLAQRLCERFADLASR